MRETVIARARYALGNCVRRATSPWRQFSIEPSQATTIFGCSFGNDGWHHLRRTLKEYDANPDIDVAQTTLWRYLKEFCPTSVSVLAGVADEPALPLFVYPWGTFNGGATFTDKEASTSRFCGPSADAFVAAEFERTIRLYKEMRVSGYRPYEYPNSFVGGTWLLADSGARRFVVMQGNHRMAVLAHLGSTSIAVRTMAQALPAVREADIESWPMVAGGRCSTRHARAVFRFFFEQSGRHVERELFRELHQR